ncbi:MAG TPA: hypothetical protein VJN18_35530 [Polyangiaceae bacterium]|nr:hypothetical protein [Polyangiaceae bacterium]
MDPAACVEAARRFEQTFTARAQQIIELGRAPDRLGQLPRDQEDAFLMSLSRLAEI